MAKYWVVGGEYMTTDFKTIKPGSEQVREGPFTAYEDAYRKWQDLSWRAVDSCNTRFHIEVENGVAAA